MKRRAFLTHLASTPLLIPSTRTIIDMAANTWRGPEVLPWEETFGRTPALIRGQLGTIGRVDIIMERVQEAVASKPEFLGAARALQSDYYRYGESYCYVIDSRPKF